MRIKAKRRQHFGTYIPEARVGGKKWLPREEVSAVFGKSIDAWLRSNRCELRKLSMEYNDTHKTRERTCICVWLKDAEKCLKEHPRPSTKMKRLRSKLYVDGNTTHVVDSAQPELPFDKEESSLQDTIKSIEKEAEVAGAELILFKNIEAAWKIVKEAECGKGMEALMEKFDLPSHAIERLKQVGMLHIFMRDPAEQYDGIMKSLKELYAERDEALAKDKPRRDLNTKVQSGASKFVPSKDKAKFSKTCAEIYTRAYDLIKPACDVYKLSEKTGESKLDIICNRGLLPVFDMIIDGVIKDMKSKD
jgi:hypothetical protein